MQLAISAKRLVIGAMATAVVAAGCGAGATPTPTGPFAIHLALTPSHVSVAMAADQGLFQGIKITYDLVGYGASSQLFQAGTDAIGNESPWEAAVYQSSGRDVRFFGTAEATNFVAGIIIRTEDKAKYPDLASLKGKKVGIPGFGTGTWAAFQTLAGGLAKLDAKKDFSIIEGGPGDLEGLLQTKAIDAMITFSAPTAHALANPAYTMIYNITDTWKKEKGAYLPINGWEAEFSWLEAHKEIAKNFIAGADAGLQYLKTHLADRYAGAKYAKFGEAEGVLASKETTDRVDQMIKDDYFYLRANVYTQAWADAVYQFIQLGDGILLDKGKTPAKDKVFYAATMY
jgi:ABC-type nitrate/sulfonate/bicarbonate transport system substrate-binding protein